MADREDPKHRQSGTPAARALPLVRKLPSARRLLVATIGAATVQFVSGCNRGSYVANLMAAPEMPAGQGGRVGQAGHGGQAGTNMGSAGFYVSNLMAPPFIPKAGSGGGGGAGSAGHGGSGGTAGSAGSEPDDAGVDDAGQA